MNRRRLVRVPASSANLGPGFDSFAVALPLLAEFDLHPSRAWTVTSADDGIPVGDDNLFVVAARAVGKAANANVPPQHVEQRSAIPIARGLGSSAAAIVCGAVAANALLGEPLDRRTLLRVGSLGFAGLTLPELFRVRAAGRAEERKEISVIVLFFSGGPRHFETWDPKPGALAEIKGPFTPIATAVPGVKCRT